MMAVTFLPEAGRMSHSGSGIGPIVLLGIAVILVIYAFYRLVKKRVHRNSSGGAQPSPLPITPGPPQQRASGDVFISYASADRPAAQALATALARSGFSTWWDRTIPAGKSYAEVIETALTGAKCVVVLWSKTSVASDWVNSEAADGARRRILIPALLEEVTIPLEFRRLQAADLLGWQGSGKHPGFRSLVDSITSLPGVTQNRL